MANLNLFTEEGRTRFRNFMLRLRSYFLFSLILGLAVGIFVTVKWGYGGLGTLQRLYLRQYAKAYVKSRVLPNRYSNYTLLLSERDGKMIGVTDELVDPVRDEQGKAVRDQSGWVFKPHPNVALAQLKWRQVKLLDRDMASWFQENIYSGLNVIDLLIPGVLICAGIVLSCVLLALLTDWRLNRRYEEGHRVRGSRQIAPGLYESEVKGADGLGLMVRPLQAGTGWGRLFGGRDRTWTLRMKRREEAQGLLILGDIGSGKSQILHRYLAQLAKRHDEAVVVYDPACEFVKAHYDRRRGDVILNPLDERSPFWSSVFECKYQTDYFMLAESFFPAPKPDRLQQTESLFLTASRDIFQRMLQFSPTPDQLVKWLSDETVIDKMLEGTELAHYVKPTAASQRAGVLGSLARVGRTLRILPSSGACKFDFSFTQWANERKGWLFLTSTKEVEDQLRPLYATYFDLLMRRLMSVDEAWGAQHPVKMIVDEAHALEYLPTLERTITEGRKYGLHLFQSIQNKHQYDDRYGRDAASTMLASPRYKIILRCNEPDSARWLSELLGEEESEKPRTSVTASVADQGRDSLHYTSQTVRRAVVSREEIGSLRDLCGYWKYGDLIVPFSYDYKAWPMRVPGFLPRASLGTRIIPIPTRPPDVGSTHSAQQSEFASNTPAITKSVDW
ncbi:MAG TPA: type IV secretion system DNA-binding domain-containing protein [Blastocatellia bacterium]|nr:type IV secretion system DNA-binding domain-containing protein [Blastocatellia bacterium]